MKKEALKLADWLEDGEVEKYDIDEASAMIRRLVEELDKQGSSIWDSTRRVYENCQCDSCKNKEPQAKPLSDEEIEECYWGDGYPDNPRHPKEFARAIEERHRIK